MPGHIESMFDECEYASDPSSVLRRASRAEAGWLARFARGRVEGEHETTEKGFERDLQVRQLLRTPSIRLGIHPDVDTGGMSTA